MFTGLIEKVSVVNSVIPLSAYNKIIISNPFDGADVKLGDSIALNGVCLTVTEIRSGVLSFDAQIETLNKTYFRNLKQGNCVNIERALPLGGRLGGHIVQGHVDEVGRVINNASGSGDWVLEIEASVNFVSQLISKCSVAIDGVSLTVVDKGNNFFTAHIVQHTLNNTNLKLKRKGDPVNLESDILGKYVYSYLSNLNTDRNQSILNKLNENGFL